MTKSSNWGDLRLRPEELRDLVEKGLDYTRKTQQLAEERRRFQELEQLYEVYSQLDDEARNAVVEAVRRTAQPEEVPLSQQLRAAGYDEDYVQAIEALEARNMSLAQKVTQLEASLSGMLPELQAIIQEVKGDAEAREVAARMKASMGIEVSPEELRAAQEATGIQDMEAAWLKANAKNLVAGAYRSGHQTGRRARPVSPAGESRAIDLANMTADEILAAINSGLIGPE